MARKERRSSHRYTPARDGRLPGLVGRPAVSRRPRAAPEPQHIGCADRRRGRVGRPRSASGSAWPVSPLQWVAANVLDETGGYAGGRMPPPELPRDLSIRTLQGGGLGRAGGKPRIPSPALDQEPSPSKPYSPETRGPDGREAGPVRRADVSSSSWGSPTSRKSKLPTALGTPRGRLLSRSLPTLVQAHQARRALPGQDRVVPLVMTVTAISLLIVFLLAIVVLARFEDIRWLGTIPIR